MKYISFAIVPFIVGLLIPMIFNLTKKSNLKKESKMNKNDFVICLSTKWAWLMIFVSVAMATLLILLNLFESSNIAANIIIPFFVVLFLFGSYACIREKIVIKENNITVSPVFSKTKKFTFSDIKKIKENSWSNGMVSYSAFGEKKLFSILDTTPGFNLFLYIIKQHNIYIETIDEQIKNRKKNE